MKKKVLVGFVAALSILFSACSSGDSTKLTGSAEDVLTKVWTAAEAALGEGNAPRVETIAVAADQAQQLLGLSGADFNTYVDSAAVSNALITTSAHEVAVIKVKNASDAAKVKGLVAAGFDAKRWICVMPDKAATVESGAYILLVASSTATADAVITAFKDAAGTTGEVNTFFTK
ncbi:MAG: hypothetical protein LBM94_00135 [Propionibacteriaceae bacterium]|jgi:aspartate 1-decarboxylase|nr:hypothetical protein [Propionibacteriaceae bacterium]